jgi:hypothetical protein
MVSPRSGDVAMMASASATDFVELRTQSVCHALIFIKLAHSKAAGSRAPITKDSALTSAGGLRRALSPTFPAGELVFFIPWRVVAENPARRILLLDLPGPAAPSISIF